MDTKALGPVEVKDSDSGEFEAVFSRFGVQDRDGDVTMRSAFRQGHRVKISSYNHGSWEGALPVGVGEIDVRDNMAVCKGRFFLNTTAGRDTFEVVKQLGDLGEWSYGFTVKDFEHGEFEGKSARFLKDLSVYEVSPVLKGAGIGTSTLSVKSHQGASFAGQCEQVLTELEALAGRGADILVKRRESGKHIGDESSELIRKILSETDRLQELLSEPESTQDEVNPLQREWLRWMATQHGLAS